MADEPTLRLLGDGQPAGDVVATVLGAGFPASVGVHAVFHEWRLSSLDLAISVDISVGQNPPTTSLSGAPLDEFFGGAPVSTGGETDARGLVELRAGETLTATAVFARGEGPDLMTRTVAVRATAVRGPARPVERSFDTSRTGRHIGVWVTNPEEDPQTVAVVDVTDAASGESLVQRIMSFASPGSTAIFSLAGPDIVPGRATTVRVRTFDALGDGSALPLRAVTLKRQRIAVTVDEVAVFDDMDAGTSGEVGFAMTLVSVSRRDRNEKKTETTRATYLDPATYTVSSDGKSYLRGQIIPCPGAPHEIVDGPRDVEPGDELVILRIDVRERDTFLFVKSYDHALGAAHLFVPFSEHGEEVLEILLDQTLQHYEDGRGALEVGRGDGVMTTVGDTNALRLYGRYSVTYV